MNKRLLEENQSLHERINLLLSNQYGSQSERFKTPSEPVFDEPQVTAEKAEEIESSEMDIKTKPTAEEKKKTGRRLLPTALPREEVICDLPETERLCACGSVKSCMGEEVSEQLEYIPAKTYVRRFVVKKYACRACDAPGIIKAKMPQQPLPKSLAGPGLLAQILTEKYLHHLPLYRHCSREYQAVLMKYSLICSMSKKRDCFDNAAMESWNGSLKVEAIHGRTL